VYEVRKSIRTGNYTEDEGLYLLQLSREDSRVVTNNVGNIIELNLQASAIAWIFAEDKKYPSLSAFKKLRKLVLGGSSLALIAPIISDNYFDLEELSMDAMGYSTVFPESFGNLTKLKTLLFSPRNSASPYNEVLLPKSFANLKSLESFNVLHSGYVNFNGTLGKLSSLKVLNTSITSITEDIGDLKNLQHIELYSRSSAFPQRFSECRSLIFARLTFDAAAAGNVVMSPKIGDLKKLETLEITTNTLYGLPDSFSGLSSLKSLSISGTGLQSIPENFGELHNLESLTLYGNYAKIPKSIGKLSKLTTLFMAGGAESLPESFGNLSALTYFNASYSSLKSLPGSIGKLKKLREINLQSSKIESLPASFANLDALQILNLSTTQLKTFPVAIIPLKMITTITLHNTNTGDIPDDIAKMKTGVVFNFYNIPNLTLDHLKYILSISKGKVFSTSFGYFFSPTT